MANRKKIMVHKALHRKLKIKAGYKINKNFSKHAFKEHYIHAFVEFVVIVIEIAW